MKTYIINSLKNTQRESQYLDYTSIIKSHEWVVFNGNNSNIEKLLFVDNKRVLVSNLGKSSYSQWEYIKTSTSITIGNDDSKYFLKIIVCNDDIIVLNIDSTNKYCFLLNSKSETLCNADFEAIQWYLIRKCGVDILSNEQRSLWIEEENRRQKETNRIEQDVRENRIKLFKWLIIVGILFFITTIIIGLIRKHKEFNLTHPTIHVTEKKNRVAVDLGLSVLWATCNIGANSPEEFGNYYGWGEPTGTDVFNHDSHSELLKRFPKREPTSWGAVPPPPHSIINTTYDMAKYNWGNGWRMPTKQEAQELIDRCRIVFTELNNRKVVKIIGPNGNCIYMPSAGFLSGFQGNLELNGDEYDEYSIFIYTGELFIDVSYSDNGDNKAAYLFIGDYWKTDHIKIKDKRLDAMDRCYLLPVRAVKDK